MLLTCSSADIGGERKIAYMSNLPTAWRKRYVFRAASESLEILQSGSRYRPYREFLCGTCRVPSLVPLAVPLE